MKLLIDQVENEGFEKLMGEIVTVYTTSFIYSGTLTGVNDECIKLTNCYIVYDTGTHDSEKWATAEKLPKDWYVMKAKIESFGIFKQVK